MNNSPEQIKYLKKLKRNSIIVNVSRAGILVIALALWEILVSSGVVDGFLFSSPSRIVMVVGYA